MRVVKLSDHLATPSGWGGRRWQSTIGFNAIDFKEDCLANPLALSSIKAHLIVKALTHNHGHEPHPWVRWGLKK
jgi:hypothetical protein